MPNIHIIGKKCFQLLSEAVAAAISQFLLFYYSKDNKIIIRKYPLMYKSVYSH